ncbi:MAG: hypothetical protein HY655_11750 [Acidobacteria bacterium]|nr:hypothetical protein [Acidobacteriota bacterium]
MTSTHRIDSGRPSERGVALVAVLLLLLVMSALAAALGVSSNTETLVARNHETLAQARASAEAGLNEAVQAAVDYLRTIDPVNIPATVDALLADATPLAIAFDGFTHLDAVDDPDVGYALSFSDDTGLGEDGNPSHDVNKTLMIRATGYGQGESSVVLEALLAPVELGAIVVDGDLDISGNVHITGGDDADVHANGDLTIDGSVTVDSGGMTASGTYDGPPPGYGSAPKKPLPEIRADDYKDRAGYVLSDDGLIVCNAAGGCTSPSAVPYAYGATMCDTGNGGNGCRSEYGWEFDGPAGWSIGSAGNPIDGTFYVEGAATISSSPTLTMTIIAEGSIDISGNPTLTSHSNELLFVTDGDLDMSGSPDTNTDVQGQVLVHEQVSLSGTVTIGGQLVVENATSEDPLVDANSVTGNVTINYNGTLGTNLFFVTGWREVRE